MLTTPLSISVLTTPLPISVLTTPLSISVLTTPLSISVLTTPLSISVLTTPLSISVLTTPLSISVLTTQLWSSVLTTQHSNSVLSTQHSIQVVRICVFEITGSYQSPYQEWWSWQKLLIHRQIHICSTDIHIPCSLRLCVFRGWGLGVGSVVGGSGGVGVYERSNELHFESAPISCSIITNTIAKSYMFITWSNHWQISITKLNSYWQESESLGMKNHCINYNHF